MQEEQIIELLCARSEKAVDVLSKEYGKLVVCIADNIVGNREDAKEIENDTYMAVWNTIPPQRPHSLVNYICRIAKNIALKRYRDEHAKKRSAVFVAIDELENCLPSPSAYDQWSAEQIGKAIDCFLGTLDRESRLAFIYRYWSGISVKQIAKLLGLTPTNVSTRLSRTRTKLKAYLREEGLL